MPDFIERFWIKVTKSDGCWEWNAYRDQAGYGRFNIGGRIHPANRVSFELANGPIPTGLLVCHRCDNPPCVNPGHLFLGTHKDNAVDMTNKGRHPHKHKTHCNYDHEFTTDNTYMSNGKRCCRKCKQLNHQATYVSRNKAA